MAGNVPVYLDQGGAQLTVGSGGVLAVAGGDLQITGGSNMRWAGFPQSVTFTPAAGGSNVCEVTIQVTDGFGDAVGFIHHLDVYLSDNADGEGLTGTTASGTVTAKTSGGTVLSTLVSKKALRVQTTSAGLFVLEITDSAKTAFRVCANLGPMSGGSAVSSALVTGNYG